MDHEDEEKVTYMGEADSRNRRLKFGIKKKDRAKHLYAIGKTGMGKSTLLENLAIQDIQNGEGVCFLDPHGKSADLLMEYVPEHRIKDVIYFAPFDMEYPISFNVMEDVGPQQRYLVASGMMSAFKKIWVDAFSARMEYILGNIILALLEYPDSTLVGVNRMLTDKDFRKEVVNNISDPSVKAFWVNEYANYTEKFAAEATPAIQNKIGQFVANPLIRNIIGQPKTAFDIREVMDNKKILIINLSKGRVGEANANLLGSLLITKIYLGAMSRADLTEKQLEAAPNFYFYVDEFQSFANESFADILSEARKYKLNLHIAHQYIEQMTDEVRAAVFGNVGTMVAFRVGAYDAEVLEKEFAPFFTAEDIVSLQKYQMYLKLMIDGVTSKPFSATGLTPPPKSPINYTNEIIASSRALYAHPRQQVEDDLLAWIQKKFGSSGGSSGGAGGGSAGGGSREGGSSSRDGGYSGGGAGGNRSSDRSGGGRSSYGASSGRSSGGSYGGSQREGGSGSRDGGYSSSSQGGRQGERQGEYRENKPSQGSQSQSGSYTRSSGQDSSGGQQRAPERAPERALDRSVPAPVAAPISANAASRSQPQQEQPRQQVEQRSQENRPSTPRNESQNASASGPTPRSGNGNFESRSQPAPMRGPSRDGSRDAQRDSKERGEQERSQSDRAAHANAREKELQKAMSLSYLKTEPNKPKEKVPKPENVAALRDALLTMMKGAAPQNLGPGETGASNAASQPSGATAPHAAVLPSEKKQGSAIQRSESAPSSPSLATSSTPAATPSSEQKAVLSDASMSSSHHATAEQSHASQQKPAHSAQAVEPKSKEVEEDILKNIFAD